MPVPSLSSSIIPKLSTALPFPCPRPSTSLTAFASLLAYGQISAPWSVPQVVTARAV